MKPLAYVLLSCMAWGQTDYVDLKPITHYCDLSMAGLCFDRSDGQGHKVPFTAEDQKKVGLYILEPKPPEPMDVPAIKHTPKLPKEDPNAPQFCTLIGDQRPSGICINGKVFNPSPRWTCVDKSRILLTDESGGKHCLKFPSGAKD